MHHSRTVLTALCATLALLVVACAPGSSITIGNGQRGSVHEGGHRHGGPPPHAPAHGYRHKHSHGGRNLELVFDSDLGIYVVVGVPDRYYWDGYYLRFDGDQWYGSVDLDHGWEPRSSDSLPSDTKKKRKRNAKAKGRKNPGPAHGRW